MIQVTDYKRNVWDSRRIVSPDRVESDIRKKSRGLWWQLRETWNEKEEWKEMIR